MKPLVVIENQNMIDLVITKYGNAESIVNFCLHNNIDMNGEVTPGDKVLIDETIPYKPTGVISEPVKVLLKAPLTVLENQNIIDLVTQEYGSVEGLVKFLTDNSIGLKTVIQPNAKLRIDNTGIVRKQMISFLKLKNIRIATDSVVHQISSLTRIFDFSFDFSYE